MDSTRNRLKSFYESYVKKAPTQARSRSVVEAILTAATERIVRATDTDDVTIREVATRAGVGVGSLYDYFGDRKSLLVAVAAKVTEDNLAEYERLLAASQHLPLPEFVDAIAGYTLDLYTKDRAMPRSVLSICYRVGLVPMLAEGQRLFAESLAKALRERSDVRVENLDAAAYLIIQAGMGLVHTMLWEAVAPFPVEIVRAELVQMMVRYLNKAL
jgi:AcrR family transcriptional regulator